MTSPKWGLGFRATSNQMDHSAPRCLRAVLNVLPGDSKCEGRWSWKLISFLGTLISLSSAGNAKAQSSGYFSGLYAGVEAGAISYNTQITFDGVDDPAGRGGAGYGAFVGYNHIHQRLLVGAEVLVNVASNPNAYTFDPTVVGFAEMDLRRGASFGLDVRAGFLVTERILLNGKVGYSINRQSVRIDDVPLDRFAGGAAEETFGTFQFGAGLEIAVHRRLGIRFLFRSLAGHDLDTTDFGTIPIDASLARFDVEPSQQQFLTGLSFCF